MKTLLIFPPQWMPVSPHFALPTLLGQFEGTGFEASVLDLNVDFYNKILTKEYVQYSLNKAKELQPILKENISKYFSKDKNYNDYSFVQKNEIAKASMIDSTLKKHGNSLSRVPLLVEKSVEILKSKEHFYNPKLFQSAINTINKALEICSMPYYPTRLEFISYSNLARRID